MERIVVDDKRPFLQINIYASEGVGIQSYSGGTVKASVEDDAL